jgi:hypothetical protein
MQRFVWIDEYSFDQGYNYVLEIDAKVEFR